MAKVAGITIDKDLRGNARYARIDLRKYGEFLNPFLKQVGIETEVSPYNKKFVKKILDGEKQVGKPIKLEDLWK